MNMLVGSRIFSLRSQIYDRLSACQIDGNCCTRSSCLTKVVFLWCLCTFGEGWSHKTCTGIKKTNHYMHKTCTGIKKQKTKALASSKGWGSIAHKTSVFGFVDACAGFAKVMLCSFSFFDACACFVTPTFTKPAQAGIKKQTTKRDFHKTCKGIQKTKNTSQ